MASVVKATFSIMDENKQGSWGEPFEVHINPSEITISNSFKTQDKRSTGNAIGREVLQAEGSTRSTLNMLLHFDLLELYESKLKKGDINIVSGKAKKATLVDVADGVSKAIASSSYRDDAGISIYNSQICCVPILERAACTRTPIEFTWGMMKYSGIFSSFNVKLTYFSAQGSPLRAEVDLAIECAFNLEDLNGKDTYMRGGSKLGSGSSRIQPGK